MRGALRPARGAAANVLHMHTLSLRQIFRCLLAGCFGLVGFSVPVNAASLPAGAFPANMPDFDPMKFFTGHTRSWGVIESRAGEPTTRIVTETWGKIVGGELRMEQDLFIEKKPRQHRSWRMRRIDAHHFEATANDVIGTAKGESRGNLFRWTFTLATKPGNALFNISMTQRMYGQPDEQTMINRDAVRKFGVTIAQVTEQFRRVR